MTSSAQGRVALITGAGGGLGSVVAPAFRSAGYQVVTEDPESRGSGPRWFDALDAEDAAAAVGRVVSAYGRIDVLLNLVGAFKPVPPVAEITDSEWESLFNVNLRSVLVVSRAVLPHMIDRGFGRIVNVGAKQGERGAAGSAPYAAAKAGVLALTEVMAEETRDKGVTVNAVVPSLIDTAANRQAMPDADFTRWTPPEHIAATMLFLSSDDAASISGERIHVFNQS
ncbi:MAG: SDR family NAD(P)-dependent oxidoreductase [Chloroflexota bacterium]